MISCCESLERVLFLFWLAADLVSTSFFRFLKMLAVFRRDVKKPDPLAPELPGPQYIPALKDGYLEKYFSSIYPRPVIVNLGNYGFMAYSADTNISPSPRYSSF